MRVLHFCLTDLAGVPSRMSRAMSQRGIDCRCVSYAPYFFPCDIAEPPDSELPDLLGDFDLIHVHGLRTFKRYHREICCRPFLIHIHGYPDWGEPSPPGLPHVVATPDLLLDFPAAAYVPTMIILDELPLSAPLASGMLRVWKSPSLHDKSSGFFSSVMEAVLKRFQSRIEYVNPQELMPHSKLRELRATCHVSFDQFNPYNRPRIFGLESLESLTQGLIAINGACDEVLGVVERAVGQKPPFVVGSTLQELGKAIFEVLQMALLEPDSFEVRRAEGPRYMKAHWSEDLLLPQWKAVYEFVLTRRAWPMDGSARFWVDAPKPS
ncbi:MAG: hypothetical protein MUC50_09380 [Myxococcota bacterium]|nr:hypothetical protein [Myxococcota bacterium]